MAYREIEARAHREYDYLLARTLAKLSKIEIPERQGASTASSVKIDLLSRVSDRQGGK